MLNRIRDKSILLIIRCTLILWPVFPIMHISCTVIVIQFCIAYHYLIIKQNMELPHIRHRLKTKTHQKQHNGNYHRSRLRVHRADKANADISAQNNSQVALAQNNEAQAETVSNTSSKSSQTLKNSTQEANQTLVQSLKNLTVIPIQLSQNYSSTPSSSPSSASSSSQSAQSALVDDSMTTKLKQNISEMQPFVLLGICFGAVFVITCIIVICCRKFHTRQLYAQSPENFTSRPNLSLPQLWRLQDKIVSLTNPLGQNIVLKQTYQGKFYEVTFKNNHNCIYFPNKLTKDCYFQIQIVKLSSVVQIGYVQSQDIDLICKKNQNDPNLPQQLNFDNYGISIKTDGTVYVHGNNQMNLTWKVQYGDTIGIGITRHQSGKRVWITRNGVIQNPPSQDQRVQFTEVGVGQKGKQSTTVKKQKQKVQEQDQVDQQKAKEQALAAKRRIQLKTRNFSYYAVVVSESPLKPLRQTVINWNIGGQHFRLHDGQELVGLLR